MPDPVWTETYDMGSTPEVNGFSRQLVGAVEIQENTSGNPALRNLTIVADARESGIFMTSSVPSLDPAIGATMEVFGNINGDGWAGFELTFLDSAIGINVQENQVDIAINGDQGPIVATAANTSDVRFRLLFRPDRTMELYRNEVEIVGGSTGVIDIPVMPNPPPFQRVLFWGEADSSSGTTVLFREMLYFIGGAVVPG